MNIFEHPLLAFFDIIGFIDPNAEAPQHPPGLSVFLGSKTRRGCPVCRNPNVPMFSDYTGARVTLSSEDATYFPDKIGTIGHMVISERVKHDLEEHGIKGFLAHRVPVAVEFDFALKGQPIPAYYLMEITGRFDIDRRRFDNFEGQLCPKCHIWKPTRGGKFRYGEKNLIPVLESWNGDDFLVQGNIRSGVLYCTRKVADLAVARKWTGFGIKVMSWGCPGGGVANLRDPNWYEDLRARVLTAFPVVDGVVQSPLDQRRQTQPGEIAWPYPPPLP